MRYWPTLTGAAFVGLMTSAAPALAQDAFATTDLNMRAGPGPQYPVVGTIENDAAVNVQGCLESWCDVVWDGNRGWAYSSYLAFDVSGTRVAVPEVGTQVTVPTASFELDPYWDEYYQDRDFYVERERYRPGGVAAGVTSGAIAGAAIGGPVGAVVGGVAGAVIGDAIVPPQKVTTYIEAQPVDPVLLQGEVVVGASLPETVALHPVPDYEYQYTVVNSQPVLVEPQSRRIVYVYR